MDDKSESIERKVKVENTIETGESSSLRRDNQKPKMTATLANLKQVCDTFELDQIDSNNLEKRWKAWLDNFEICTEYEGIEDTKKRRAALLAVGGAQLRELHSTLEEGEEKNYDTVKTVLNNHFKGKKI